MTAAALAPWLVDLGRGARESVLMGWETLWAIVLGFGISGAVQAFVPRTAMQRRLGTHRPAAVARATGLGAASSSCSYAAAATTRALVARGADLLTSLAFLVASTNLVVDLGLVLLALLGWRFLLGEYVGGPLMIVVVVLLGGMVLRRHLAPKLAGGDAPAGEDRPSSPRTLRGWTDAASFALGDLRMLRRELAIGFVAAGFLAVLVPVGWWQAMFLHGHGAWTVAENALVGPVAAALSCVCSIGNVPLAAALWHGGISFGGVVSFVLGDLVALPLVLVYRRQYGAALAARIAVLLYVAMVAAGLGVEGLFELAGLVPASHRVSLTAHATGALTTGLDLAAIAMAATFAVLARRRPRSGETSDLAADPMCGMQVRTSTAAVSTPTAAGTVYFCSEGCRERFLRRRATAGPDVTPGTR